MTKKLTEILWKFIHSVVTRAPSASTATGNKFAHYQELEEFIEDAMYISTGDDNNSANSCC